MIYPFWWSNQKKQCFLNSDLYRAVNDAATYYNMWVKEKPGAEEMLKQFHDMGVDYKKQETLIPEISAPLSSMGFCEREYKKALKKIGIIESKLADVTERIRQKEARLNC